MLRFLSWTEWLTALTIVLQTVELLAVRSYFSDNGVWRWEVIRREFETAPYPVRLLTDALCSYRFFLPLLVFRLLAATLVVFIPSWPLFAFLLLSQVIICVRWRGTFNGGSDYMTVILLSALLFASLFERQPTFCFAALCYVALQSFASYTVAGYAKLRSHCWRNGIALSLFLEESLYEAPTSFQALLRKSYIQKLLAWGVLAYECGFPLIFLHPIVCVGFLGAGFLFHLLNAYLFGLNRFLLTWIATYPALYLCASIFRIIPE